MEFHPYPNLDYHFIMKFTGVEFIDHTPNLNFCGFPLKLKKKQRVQ